MLQNVVVAILASNTKGVHAVKTFVTAENIYKKKSEKNKLCSCGFSSILLHP